MLKNHIFFVEYLLTNVKTSKLRLVNISWAKKPGGIRIYESKQMGWVLRFFSFEINCFRFGTRMKGGIKNTKIETGEHFWANKNWNHNFRTWVCNKKTSEFELFFLNFVNIILDRVFLTSRYLNFNENNKFGFHNQQF